MAGEQNSQKIPALICIVSIVLSFAGSILYLAYDVSEQAYGYDHDSYNNLLFLYDKATHNTEGHLIKSSGDAYTLFYPSSLLAVLIFGLNRWAAMLVPFIGWALILFFGYKLGKQLGNDDRLAGWLAASTLALTPLVFGLSRKFSPWTLVLGLFLGLSYRLARYQQAPGVRNALLMGAFLVLGIAAPHDMTTQLLFIFFALLFIGVIITHGLLNKTVSPAVAVSTVLILAVLFCLSVLLPSTSWTKEPMLDYYSGEVDHFSHSFRFFDTLPGYFVDIYRSLFRPIGTFLIGMLLLAFVFKKQREGVRLWAFIPLLGIAVLSLFPKKNSWYILECSAILPVLAAVALASWAAKLPNRKSLCLVAVWHLLLFVQYVHCSFFAWQSFATSYDALSIFHERFVPITQPVQTSASTSYREMTDDFLKRYEEFFPGTQKVCLGVVVDYHNGFDTVPFYLRTSGKPLALYLAAYPGAPELGSGLDAVAFFPSRYNPGHTADVLQNTTEFHDIYVNGLTGRLIEHREKDLDVSIDRTSRLLNSWKISTAIQLDKGVVLFIPAPRK